MQGTATRRQILHGMGTLAAGLAAGTLLPAAARARIHSKRVISMQPRLYHGWPTLARRRNGELLVVCSGGRESHVCPFGRVELMRSRDEGRHWSFPRVLIDGPIDDRDAGVVETAEGSLLVTTFTSVGYASILARAEGLESQGKGAWPREKLDRWQAIHSRITAAEREIELGSWMIRSTDGGRSWSAPYRCPVNSPHGPIQLSDGRLLYAGKIFWYGPSGQSQGRIGVCESTDDGESWRWLAEIPTRKGDDYDAYHELHAVETSEGALIAHIRNHNTTNERETLQSRLDRRRKNLVGSPWHRGVGTAFSPAGASRRAATDVLRLSPAALMETRPASARIGAAVGPRPSPSPETGSQATWVTLPR